MCYYRRMSDFVPTPEKISWLFLDMNSFFASVEQQENPNYIGKPLIVLPTMTDATCVIAASYEAKAYGIKTGTNVGDAKEKCPKVICVPARHDIYLKYHKMMESCVARHTPITKIWSIDELSSRLAPSKCHRDAAIALARTIKADMRSQIGAAVTCSIGLASNSYLAKIATNMQKPDGLVIIKPHDIYQRLHSLSLDAFPGIGKNMEIRLNKCGIWTFEHLWQCSAKQLRAIWRSVEGEKFWYRIRGYDIPDIQTNTSIFGHSRVLEPRLRAPEDAGIVLSQLTEKACNRMRRKGYAAQLMSISIRSVAGVKYSSDFVFSPPCRDNITCVRALHSVYHGLIQRTNSGRLKKVSVSFSKLIEIPKIHPDLFYDYANKEEKEEKTPMPYITSQPHHNAQYQTEGWRHTPPRPIYHRNLQPVDEKDSLHYSAVPRGRPRTSHHKRQVDTRLSKSIDHIIKTFGSDSIHFGCAPEVKSQFVGTKIAFSRIPDQEEFW